VDGKLAGQQFLTGDTFTVADAYMFVMLTWAKKMQLDIPKNLTAFFDRVAKREGVQEAMRQEGLIEKKAA
jgi:glutathione S-transferase